MITKFSGSAPAAAGAAPARGLLINPDGGEWLLSRRDRLAMVAVVGLYIAARLVTLPSYRPWFDEIFSLEIAWRDWPTLFWFVQNFDVHPPLFYMLAKLWVDLGGQSFLWLGLFPALTAIAALLPTYWLARELRLRPAEFNFMVLLMAVNAYLTGYAQEFRVYDLLMTLSIASLWLFVRYYNAAPGRETVWRVVALGIVNLVLGYSHYYGWFVIGAEGLFLLLWNPRKVVPFAIASIAGALAYVPWAYLVIRAAEARVGAGRGALYFIPRPDLFSVVFFYGALNGLFDVPNTTSAGVLLFAIPVLFWMARAFVGKAHAADRPLLVWLAILSSVPVLLAFVISLAVSPIWGQRHLIVTAVPYYLLVTLALFRLPTPALRRIGVAVIAAWAIASGVLSVKQPYKIAAWDTLADRIVAQTPPGQKTRVYAINEDAAYPMQFYLWRSHRTDIEVAVLQSDTPEHRARFYGPDLRKPYWALSVPVVLVKQIADLNADTPFWVMDDRDKAPEIGFPEDSLKDAFSKSGFDVQQPFSTTLINRRFNVRTVGVFVAARRLASGRPPM